MNASQFSKVMRRLAKIGPPATRAITKDLNAEIQRNFDAGLDANRKPFHRLSKAYKRRRRFQDKPILTQTGAGRATVKLSAYGGGIRAVIGSEYMVIHQLGGPIMPRRAPLPMGKLPAAWREIALYNYEKQARRVIG